MVDVNYSEAVQALASGINAKSGSLDGDRKIQLARSLIHQDDVESLDEWSEIELQLSGNALQKLREYSAELHQAYDAEIGKEIHLSIENTRKLSELRSELKEKIDIAMNEDHEMEKIAERLQDPDLGKIAGKEEHEINELGRKLEKLDKKGKEVEKLEQKLLDTTNKLGIGHGELHQTLQKRSKTVGQLIKKATIDGSSSSSDGSSTSDKPWKEFLNDLGYNVDKSSTWAYGPRDGNIPYQGFKMHISGQKDEAEEIVKVLAPILSGNKPISGETLNVDHKCYKSMSALESNTGNQQKKIFTIYPEAPKNKHAPDRGKITLKQGDKKYNRKSIYSNQENFINLIDKISQAIKSSSISLSGGPEIDNDIRYNGSRIQFRYAAIAPFVAEVQTSSRNITITPSRNFSDSELNDFMNNLDEIGIRDNPQISKSAMRSEFNKKSSKRRETPIFDENGTISGTSYKPPKEQLQVMYNLF